MERRNNRKHKTIRLNMTLRYQTTDCIRRATIGEIVQFGIKQTYHPEIPLRRLNVAKFITSEGPVELSETAKLYCEKGFWEGREIGLKLEILEPTNSDYDQRIVEHFPYTIQFLLTSGNKLPEEFPIRESNFKIIQLENID